MERLLRYSLVIASALLFLGCGSKSKGPSSGSAAEARSFPSGPDVPSVMSDPSDILDFRISHFWDAFTDTSKVCRCDTAFVNGVPKAEAAKALSVFLNLLEQNSLDRSRKAVSSLFDKTETFEAADTSTNVFEFFEEGMAKCLYGPNSPLRNEDLYLPFVSRLAASEYVSDDLKPAYSRDALMCSLNQAGTPAADFTFTLRNGKKMTLYSIKADWTLLFFSNPGCPSCEEVIRTIKEDSLLAGLVRSGRLAVVNVYIDSELDKWRDSCADYPSEWYNGYDQDYVIRMDVIYNVRAIPSLYVLDSEKNVLVKDAPVEKVLALFDDIQNK